MCYPLLHVWWRITSLNILRVTATYEWKVEDLTHTCVDGWMYTSLRGFVESSRGQNVFRNVLHDRFARLYFKQSYFSYSCYKID